jgi:SAM-dependent methyltransferase
MAVRRLIWWLGYRFAFAPWDTGRPVPMLVEAVDGPDRLAPGRALDLGCGTGTNTIFLAHRGWEATGVDLVGHAIELARRRAQSASLQVRLLEGDVTRLDALGAGGGFDLLVDSGCYHVLPPARRAAYVAAVTAAAAPRARLLLFGVGRTPVPGVGVTESELRTHFTGWRLVSAVRISPDELPDYVDTAGWLGKATFSRWFDNWRYRLERTTHRQ